VRAAAVELTARLVDLLPTAAGEIRARSASLDAEIAALDAELAERLARPRARSFLVFHPALGILAGDYGLEQVAIERDGKEPSPAQLARTVEWARRERVRVVLVQRGLPTRAAEAIAREIGGRTLEIAPLDVDWLGSMRRIAAALEVALDRG
jgi:zinc transport system substrate-binding protein